MDSEQDSTQDTLDSSEEAAPAGVGEQLRAAREASRLDLAHIAAETRIPIRHLQSIEQGDFTSLPSRTYAIGFAKTFARAVELDEEEIAQLVREELANGHARQSALAGGMEPGDAAKLPSAGLAWFGGIAALILAIGVIAFASTYFGAGAELPSLLASEDETSEAGDESAPTGVAAADNTAANATPGAALSDDGQVVFTATGEGAWVRFYEEGGERLYEGVMEDGDTYEVPLDAQDPRLNTGRPNLFRITINGQAVPPLAEEMVPVSDAPVSASSLLARAEVGVDSPVLDN